MHARLGRDEHEPQLIAERLQTCSSVRRAVDIDLGVERRADRVGVAQLLELAHDAAAHAQDRVPVDLRTLRRTLRQRDPCLEEHRLVARARHVRQISSAVNDRIGASQRTIASTIQYIAVCAERRA